jgi:hypothetical protein
VRWSCQRRQRALGIAARATPVPLVPAPPSRCSVPLASTACWRPHPSTLPFIPLCCADHGQRGDGQGVAGHRARTRPGDRELRLLRCQHLLKLGVACVGAGEHRVELWACPAGCMLADCRTPVYLHALKQCQVRIFVIDYPRHQVRVNSGEEISNLVRCRKNDNNMRHMPHLFCPTLFHW